MAKQQTNDVLTQQLDVGLTDKQLTFVQSDADEILYGGAAGGGKTYAQVMDALIYAVHYPRSKQIIFRRTYGELELSVVQEALRRYPRPPIAKYNQSKRVWTFANGSRIWFGYIARKADVYQYQSAEFDVIRFDELTHFTEEQYTYMLTRLRGALPYPRSMRSSSNPGNVGHAWVKERFIDPAPPGVEHYRTVKGRERKLIFIPARVQENVVLMENDPDYLLNLEEQPDVVRRQLLDGDWSAAEGQAFREFSVDVHVIDPRPIPEGWARYRAIDYGLDCYACLWFAVSPTGEVWVYKEIAQSDLIISEAAKKTLDYTKGEEEALMVTTWAPPDVVRSRSQETGRTKADLFRDAGLTLWESSNDREAGWMAIHEMLKIGENGEPTLKVFRNCYELIKCLPALIIDDKKPNDVSTEPHQFTHVPDALRYFAVAWWRKPTVKAKTTAYARWSEDMWEDYRHATAEERVRLIEIYGRPRGL